MGGDITARAYESLITMEEEITGEPLVAGNAARLLIDGPATYSAMFARIQSAQREVYLETFILQDDEVGQRLARHLREAAGRGVVVRLLFDGLGSVLTGDRYFETLEDAGVMVRKYNPPDPLENPRVWKLNNRTHRKLLVVDGETAFLGGVNFSGEYSTSSSGWISESDKLEQGWRDTHLMLDGPIAARYRSLFIRNWAETGDAVPASESARDIPAQEQGDHLVRMLASEGGDDEYEIYESYRAAINHARQSIWLTHAYFSPDDPSLEDLEKAALRGVDVRLLLPGFSDSTLVLSASRSNYQRLLDAGVRIFERNDSLLHAKTAVIDGVWSTVGSANLDMRSFIHNHELNAIIIGRSFGEQMEQLFVADLEPAQEVLPEQWRQRPLWERAREAFGKLFNYWL